MEVSLRESTEIDGLGAAGINDAASTSAERKKRSARSLPVKFSGGAAGTVHSLGAPYLVVISKPQSHSHTQSPGTALCVNRIR